MSIATRGLAFDLEQHQRSLQAMEDRRRLTFLDLVRGNEGANQLPKYTGKVGPVGAVESMFFFFCFRPKIVSRETMMSILVRLTSFPRVRNVDDMAGIALRSNSHCSR